LAISGVAAGPRPADLRRLVLEEALVEPPRMVDLGLVGALQGRHASVLPEFVCSTPRRSRFVGASRTRRSMEAKNSFAFGRIASHGGFPMTASKPRRSSDIHLNLHKILLGR
jgi:hypothetical protein